MFLTDFENNSLSLLVTTILNPAPKKDDLSDEVYPVCDIFCPNETEVSSN